MAKHFRKKLAGAPAGGIRESGRPGADGATLAEHGVRSLVAFILAGAHIFGALSPFAVGFIASSGSGSVSIATLLGGVIGYLIFGPVTIAFKYIAIIILVATVANVFRFSTLSKTAWFMPVAAAAISACVSFVTAPASAAGAAYVLSDTALAAGCAYFYKAALSPWSGRLNFDHTSEIVHTVSVLILISTLLISLSGVRLFGIISIGRAAAALVVFFASYKGGAPMGCATGLTVGLAMDVAAGGTPFFSTAYGLGGLISGVFSKQSRFVFAVSFILSDAVVAAISQNAAGVPSILYEIFIASVIFMVLPASFMAKLGALLPGSSPGYGMTKAREYTKKRVEQTSRAFRDLYETVKDASPPAHNDADVTSVFDKAADAVCRKCANTGRCWQQNYQTTVDVMNNASPNMLLRGELTSDDFPVYFADICLHLENFVSAVNGELRGLLYRQQYRTRLRANQAAAFSQYSDISSILSDISAELGSGVKFEPELEKKLQKYLGSLNLEPEIAVFRDRGGRIHAEFHGHGLGAARRAPGFLDCLSDLLGVRLCMPEREIASGRLTLLEAEPLAAFVGIACLKKKGQDTSGDRGAYFKTDEGVLHVLLSDGMGSGEEAAKYSRDAVSILKRFLRSGVESRIALRLLNDLLVLKNENDTGCATVDLISINLFTGESQMYKYGAAPSYLRSADEVRSFRGKSFAAGLGAPPNDAPDHVALTLTPDCLAVVVSDGVISGDDDAWIIEMIKNYKGSNPRELAGGIVDEAAKKFRCEDDMTVIAIIVEERE